MVPRFSLDSIFDTFYFTLFAIFGIIMLLDNKISFH